MGAAVGAMCAVLGDDLYALLKGWILREDPLWISWHGQWIHEAQRASVLIPSRVKQTIWFTLGLQGYALTTDQPVHNGEGSGTLYCKQDGRELALKIGTFTIAAHDEKSNVPLLTLKFNSGARVAMVLTRAI